MRMPRAAPYRFDESVASTHLLLCAGQVSPWTRISPSAGMPGLANPKAPFELQLHADHFLHAVVSKVGVLRREGGFRVDPENVGIDRLIRTRIEIDVGGLADLHFADLPFGDKAAQIDFAQIEQRDDGGTGCNHFAGLGGPGDNVPLKGASIVRSRRLSSASCN